MDSDSMTDVINAVCDAFDFLDCDCFHDGSSAGSKSLDDHDHDHDDVPFHPPDDDAFAGGDGGDGTGTENNLLVYDMDQIADQLTFGYWNSTSGGGERSFNISPGGSLTVDITELGATGQLLARQALDAWAAVTGIDFVEVDSVPSPTATTSEATDAATGTSTVYAISPGEAFAGTLATGADRDAVAVQLVAGRTYTILLAGDRSGGNPTLDPYLRVFNPAGSQVAENDDFAGRDSRLTFTPGSSGTYYLQAGSYADSYAGDYLLQIVEGRASAQITFGDQASGAYAQSVVIGGEIISSSININFNWVGGESRTDGYHYQTYLHEIGHALGLGHAGNYNGGATYGVDNHYANDSWATSLMSYFHQSENTSTSGSFAYAITPMIADIIAIQNLYGAADRATGDTVYGRGGNGGDYLDTALDFSNPVAWTIYDTGGTDHLNFSGYLEDQRIDLTPESWSDVAGLYENITIMRGTIIEWATSGDGADHLTGNVADNALWAGAGDDTVLGGAGHDVILGQDGNDNLDGGDGRDLIEGGAGNNQINGGSGGDLLIGGDVDLATLTALFPTWTPPPDAQSRINSDELHVLWDDILLDVFGVA